MFTRPTASVPAVCLLAALLPLAGRAADTAQVEQMLRAGIREDLIVGFLRAEGAPAALSSADLQRLRDAGASETLIAHFPAAAVTPAAVAPRAGVPAAAPEPAPAQALPPLGRDEGYMEIINEDFRTYIVFYDPDEKRLTLRHAAADIADALGPGESMLFAARKGDYRMRVDGYAYEVQVKQRAERFTRIRLTAIGEGEGAGLFASVDDSERTRGGTLFPAGGVRLANAEPAATTVIVNHVYRDYDCYDAVTRWYIPTTVYVYDPFPWYYGHYWGWGHRPYWRHSPRRPFHHRYRPGPGYWNPRPYGISAWYGWGGGDPWSGWNGWGGYSSGSSWGVWGGFASGSGWSLSLALNLGGNRHRPHYRPPAYYPPPRPRGLAGIGLGGLARGGLATRGLNTGSRTVRTLNARTSGLSGVASAATLSYNSAGWNNGTARRTRPARAANANPTRNRTGTVVGTGAARTGVSTLPATLNRSAATSASETGRVATLRDRARPGAPGGVYRRPGSSSSRTTYAGTRTRPSTVASGAAAGAAVGATTLPAAAPTVATPSMAPSAISSTRTSPRRPSADATGYRPSMRPSTGAAETAGSPVTRTRPSSPRLPGSPSTPSGAAPSFRTTVTPSTSAVTPRSSPSMPSARPSTPRSYTPSTLPTTRPSLPSRTVTPSERLYTPSTRRAEPSRSFSPPSSGHSPRSSPGISSGPRRSAPPSPSAEQEDIRRRGGGHRR